MVKIARKNPTQGNIEILPKLSFQHFPFYHAFFPFDSPDSITEDIKEAASDSCKKKKVKTDYRRIAVSDLNPQTLRYAPSLDS